MQAFNTVAMSGFPNFFYILGPNAGRGHTSTLYTVEVYGTEFVSLISRERTNKSLATST